MSADFSVTGAEDFLRLSKALKEAGRGELRKELHKTMRAAAKPLIKDARDAALAEIPHRGGLAQRISKQTFTAQVRTGVDTAGLRITRPGKFVTSKLLNERGAFRHPVFADAENETRRQWHWVPQQAPSALGWFDRAMTANAPKIQPDILAAMQRVVDTIVRESQ